MPFFIKRMAQLKLKEKIMIKKTLINGAFICGMLLAGFNTINAQEPFNVPEVDSNKLLSTQFATKHIEQIESGSFHFFPWQIGPIHTHPAICVGYMIKGDIVYQVEGEKPQMLETGKAFYEPSGPRIMRFDNASATGESLFVDFCPQQKGEPFLLFEKDPTEFIDRRALSTLKLNNRTDISQIDVYEHMFAAKGHKDFSVNNMIIAGFVESGEIEINRKGSKKQSIKAGENFYITMASQSASIVNSSKNNPAKVITFNMQ